jgi:gas vesicle protein
MSSTKKTDDIRKENIDQIKESTNKYLDQQKQQIKNTVANVSDTTEKITQNVSKFQEDNRRIFENNVETLRKNQEQFGKTSQEISNNTVELQKNIFDAYQSSCVQFFDNINNSYWKNFNTPQRYSEIYNTLNKNIQDNTVNATNFINEITVGGIENFNKSLELTQRYYNDIVQNNLNYTQKIERSFNRQ